MSSPDRTGVCLGALEPVLSYRGSIHTERDEAVRIDPDRSRIPPDLYRSTRLPPLVHLDHLIHREPQ